MTETNFYDTQPTQDHSEANAVDGIYEDPTNVPEIDKEISEGVKDPISTKLATWIRQKVYGKDVRETMARFILWMSVLYNRILSISNKLTIRQDQLEKDLQKMEQEFDDVTANATEDMEVIRARSSLKTGITYKTLGNRLDAMEAAHYTIERGRIDTLILLEDNNFSKNHEVLELETVNSIDETAALVIAEIDSTEQDTYYLQEVGEIDV